MWLKKQKLGRVGLIAAAACVVMMLTVVLRAGYSAYGPHTPITSISIENPTASEVWLAGSDHTVTCTTGSDMDCNLGTGEPVSDSVTHYWSGTGTFKDNDNVGTSVTYLCTNTAVSNSITAHCNDDYAPESNAALSDEGETTDTETVTVVIPWVEELNFSGTNNYAMMDDADPPVEITVAEYDKSLGRNEPACQKMDSTVTLSGVKFRASSDLTESSSVAVNVTGTVDFDDANDSWQTWDSSGITMTSKDIAAGHTETSVGIYDNDFSLTWKFKDPSGTNTYITCAATNATTHKVYVVLGQPQAAQAVPWQKLLDEACYAGSLATSASVATCYMWAQLYMAAGGSYDTENGASAYANDPKGTTGDFKLKSWLNALPEVGTVNCYDMAKALVVYANAVGCDTDYTYVSPFGYLNCIEPIGKDWTNNPFYDNALYDDNPIVDGDWDVGDGRSRFSNHAFARLSDDIYDASGGTVDVDGTPDAAPHTSTRYLDGDDTWTDDYRDRVIDDDPASSPGPLTPHGFDAVNE